MTKALYCPYCYRDTAGTHVFRCAGGTGPTGKRCELKIDPVLHRQTGDNTPKYPAFTVKRPGARAICPHCKERTWERICQHCHSTLPVHFGTADNRLIALVGAKESGKTVYMTVLLHELMNQVGDRLDASVLGADDHTLARFTQDYEDLLYRKRELHQQTRSAAAGTGGRRPLVFSLSLTSGRRYRSQLHRTLLSFFDTAGEDLRSADSVAHNTRYLEGADGIILLLDPLQMSGARPLAAPGTVLPEQAPADSDPLAVLSRITDLLHGSLGTSKGLINKPLAIVFTKMDAMEGTLPLHAAVLRHSPTDVAFDEDDSVAVDGEIRDLLHKWQGTALKGLLHNNYRRHRFFGVTALGGSPVLAENGAQRISDYGVLPRRVHDPFLWLLTQFGTVKPARKK